jgi:hypothetical protein
VVIPVVHEPYPKGTVLAKEVVAWFAGSYGGVSSGPFYAMDDERMQAHDAIMAGPATVRCGGGAVSQTPQIAVSAPDPALPAARLDHPVLPLVRAEDGGLGRMTAANGPESDENYRSADEMRLKAAVSAEADTSWIYSDHAIDVAAAPGLATALIACDVEALAL